MTKIRQIVKDALKVDELVYQFQRIDVEDSLLTTGNALEINEKYSDNYIIGEALNRLDIAMDESNQENLNYIRDAKQLRKFLKKWEK